MLAGNSRFRSKDSRSVALVLCASRLWGSRILRACLGFTIVPLSWKLGKKSQSKTEPEVAYSLLHSGIVELLQTARRGAAGTVNAIIASAYWEIGRRIVQEEQKGHEKAGYGERLIDRLSSDLMAQFGRGFSGSNVFQMRQFYLAHLEIVQTPSGQSKTEGIVQTLSGQLKQLPAFPLSWSH
jgi:hypothetical protein